MTSMNIDMSKFKAFYENLSGLNVGEKASYRATMQIANEWMAKAQARTPSPTGTMKSSWHVDDEGRSGTENRARVYNTAKSDEGAPYPIYVEYGHRQKVGQYVPAIGKRLVKPWVPGQFMLTKSRLEMEQRVPNIIAKHVQKAWDEL